MLSNLRQKIEADGLYFYGSKSQWGLPVRLTSPNGVQQSNPVINGTVDLTTTLKGQVLYDIITIDPETGAQVIEHKPVATLRISELIRVPAPGEKWLVAIPLKPDPNAPLINFFLERPSEDGQSIGFIRLYLMNIERA